ncbi:hypothetical protein OPAG_08167 [Rhodococcus opacus PD630]|uniref:hypothetical protein n=1 Tax=Rhodococcus opacus TaxID=37919 RepID=UPI00029CD50D|nr:hypothetical protein [Rhodococcus opacus]AHK35372.1 hypothetical protein Pd630_LPD09132 [Rhodococcus opacus PD630]EHI41346.1 hypothetical protein OPAG_08167 [Rhodococcus opacus PD630]
MMKIGKTKTKVEVAAAVGAGYLLGRTHQLKMAVKIAGAGGRSPKGPEDLLAQGSEFLASSPEIADLGDSVRGKLLDTAAATAEASSEHVNSFRDRLRSGGAHVAAGRGHLVAGVKKIGHRGHAHPQGPEDSTLDEALDHGKDEDGRSSQAVQEEQQTKPHRLRKPRITTPSDSAGEPRDKSAQEARPDTTARRKRTAKAH